MSEVPLVTVKGYRLMAETDKAILIAPPNTPKHDTSQTNKIWLPSALISHNTFDGLHSYGEVEIPQWLAEKNDLPYEEED